METSEPWCSVIYVPRNDTSHYTFITLVISSLGVGLSVCAFFLLILTAFLFAEWRQNRKNQIIIQFMLARILYMLVRYVVDIEKVFTDFDIGCNMRPIRILAIIYTECTLIAWMCQFTKHMNDSLVKVFNVSKQNMFELSFCTWAIPGIVSGLLFIAYTLQNSKDSYIVFLIYLVFIKWPVLSVNAYFLITAIKAILITNQSHTENNIRIIVVMIVLLFCFSFQQVIVDVSKIIHFLVTTQSQRRYLLVLNILAIYQCAVSITFWVFGNSKTRNLWKCGNKSKSASPSQLAFRISISDEIVSK